mmetsp:Transcript_5971/g.14345  ORF Transcript_5971/g.14345 Transcript_5971/m.14345 type:complete len:245 (+) Transcript_5971:641-1375(+)
MGGKKRRPRSASSLWQTRKRMNEDTSARERKKQKPTKLTSHKKSVDEKGAQSRPSPPDQILSVCFPLSPFSLLRCLRNKVFKSQVKNKDSTSPNVMGITTGITLLFYTYSFLHFFISFFLLLLACWERGEGRGGEERRGEEGCSSFFPSLFWTPEGHMDCSKQKRNSFYLVCSRRHPLDCSFPVLVPRTRKIIPLSTKHATQGKQQLGGKSICERNSYLESQIHPFICLFCLFSLRKHSTCPST